MRRAILALAALTLACGESSLTPDVATQAPGVVNLGRVGVVTGDFDRAEELLDVLGVSFTLYDGWVTGPPADAALASRYDDGLESVEELFLDEAKIGRLDTLVVNCGARGMGTFDPSTLSPTTDVVVDPTARRNLVAFVEGGGRLVVTDQSYNLLTAHLGGLLAFYGDDATLNAALVGAGGEPSAVVVDAGLQQALGAAALPLKLHSGWAVAQGGSGLLAAPAQLNLVGGGQVDGGEVPVALVAPQGEGLVLFTSFHLTPKVDQTHMEMLEYLLRLLERT